MTYFARKFGFFLATLWAVVTLNFLIPRLQPGDPAEIMVKRLAGKDAAHEPVTRANLKDKMPDYYKYLVGIFGFDPDAVAGTPVASAN